MVQLSPDQRFAYVISEEGSVAGYRRNRRTGALRGLTRPGGCVAGREVTSDVPAASVCSEWDVLGPAPEAAGFAISPDGRNAYLATGGTIFVPPSQYQRPGALAILRRDVGTGALDAGSCIAAAVSGCMAARGVGSRVTAAAVSPDGRHVYVGSSVEAGVSPVAAEPLFGSSIAGFVRDPASGGLSQLPGTGSCVAPDGYPGCERARGLSQYTASVAISPDGRNLYMATASSGGDGRSTEGTILAFSRDPDTGTLTQLQGPAACLVTDGRDGCGAARALGNWPTQLPELALSPDGSSLYAAFLTGGTGLSGGVSAFRRDPASGALAQLSGEEGCISERGIQGCRSGRGLDVPTGVTVSPDGRNVYVSAFNSASIAAFARRPSGALRQLPGAWGCIGFSVLSDEGCTTAPGLQRDMTLSSDGSYGYIAQDGGMTVLARNAPRVTIRPASRCGRSGLDVVVSIWVDGGLRRAVVRLDGRQLTSRARRRFTVNVPRRRLGRGRHRLSVLAVDRRGRKSLTTRRVNGCQRA